MSQPRLSPADCIDALIARVGRRLVVGTPLGLGKANYLLNELYRRACADGSIDLTIVTALTLEPPVAGSDLEARFLDPLVARLFAGYPRLDYAQALGSGTLPANVTVHEFFFAPGSRLGVAHAQQNYISSNYTHAARDMLSRGANVVLQMVSPGGSEDPGRLSLSCNPDVTLDLVPRIRALGEPCAIVGEINDQLPYMYGDAVVDEGYFDLLCAPPGGGYTLFGTPKSSISATDYAIGLYASALVRDGGTLQVGIGGMGDAVVYGLGLRHSQPDAYRRFLDGACAPDTRALVERWGGVEPFEHGLYGASEMLVDGFVDLFERGILTRRVYDDVALQRVLNRRDVDLRPGRELLRELVAAGAVGARLDAAGLAYLRRFGILHADVELAGDQLCLGDGTRIANDLADEGVLAALEAGGFGSELAGASVAHGGFFLGPRSFYAALREMPVERRRLLKMTGVGRINQLYGGEDLDRAQRPHARFINSCMMVTLDGAVVSDGLSNGRVVSGVGGQYNFVAMAHALEGGRSIIKARATRESHGQLRSTIVMSYGYTTIPRHLRDIVVTEYGIADLRGKSDAECYAALLNVADSRFQPGLLREAIAAGKLPAEHVIPQFFRANTPAQVARRLQDAGGEDLFPPFPFGTDLTDLEQRLGKALLRLKAATGNLRGRLRVAAGAATANSDAPDTRAALSRLGLETPHGVRERLYRRLVAWALNST